MGELVVINDSSGSIRDAEIGVIASELNAIRETVNPERMRVIWADDCECSHEEVFEQNEPLELHPKGGGGTDMRKPLKFVEQYEPIITVLITDGHTPWPAIAPPFPLIVCCTTDEPVPDYAEVVRLRA
jgi:predicted metal-dependent peptidase